MCSRPIMFLPRCMKCRRGLAMSVRPSVCQTRGLWQNGRKICPDFYTVGYEKLFRLVLWEEEWLVGNNPLYLKFWVNRPHLEPKMIIVWLPLRPPKVSSKTHNGRFPSKIALRVWKCSNISERWNKFPVQS